MNKKCIGLLLAIPALMGFGLTSCSNDEPILTKEESSTRQVEVSFIAELGGASRASLTFDENKNLKFKWDSEDIVYAVNADNGKYLGKLTVSKVLEDPRNCEFKGTISLPTLGSANLKFYYLGEKGKMEFDTETYSPKDIEVDYSAQTGTAAELDDYDLLKAEKAYNSTENGKLGRLSFARHFSTAQFVLKYNGEELNLNGKTVSITAASGTLYNKASLNYKSGDYTHYEGRIEVTPSTNNFYLNLIPTESVQFKFTVAMGDGKVFEGVKGGRILEDTYYSDNLEAIVVEMKNTDGSDDEQNFVLKYAPNYTPTSEGDKVYDKKRVGSAEYTVQTYDLFTREGYTITGWNTEADGTGKAYAAGDTFTITWPDTEATLYAQWKQNTYDWTITWKDETSDTPSTKVEKGNAVAGKVKVDFPVNNPVKDGYTFNGWVIEGTDTPAPSEITIIDKNVDYVFVPTWTKNDINYVLRYEDENSNEIDKKIVVSKEDEVTVNVNDGAPSAPEKAGYEFVGWAKKNTSDVVSTVTLTKANKEATVVPVYKKKATVTTPGYGSGTFNK